MIWFDLDNTLVDTDLVKQKLWQTARKFGISKKLALERYLLFREDKSFIPESYASHLFPGKLELQEKFVECFEEQISSINLTYKGVGLMLLSLKKEFQLGMITFGEESFQGSKLKYSGLQKYFNAVEYAKKPSKIDGFASIKTKFGILSKHALVDDSAIALQAGKEWGFNAVKVKKSFKDAEYFLNLERRIRRVYDK